MDEQRYFSIWFGLFDNEIELQKYTEVIYPSYDDDEDFDPQSLFIDDPNDQLNSGFINDFDLDSGKYSADYDEDFSEFYYKKDCTNNYKELLTGVSYDDQVIPKVTEITSSFKEKFNCILILYNYRYQQFKKINEDGNVIFIGTFKYDPYNYMI